MVPPPLRAAPSSFYWAMRLLPNDKRDAIFEIYSFCRTVDDIADGDFPEEDKIELLGHWRHRIDDVMDGTEAVAFSDGFSKTIVNYRIDRDDLFAVIDGMQSDAVGKVIMNDMDELNIYMDRVASAVGKISNKIFGLKGSAADDLAVNLGRALQLTNILRDVAEDANDERVYIPLSVLRQHSITSNEPLGILHDEKLPLAIVFMAQLAQKYFDEAGKNLNELPAGKTRPVRIMKAVYKRTLDKMIRRGWRYPYSRVSISRVEKMIIAARAALFA